MKYPVFSQDIWQKSSLLPLRARSSSFNKNKWMHRLPVHLEKVVYFPLQKMWISRLWLWVRCGQFFKNVTQSFLPMGFFCLFFNSVKTTQYAADGIYILSKNWLTLLLDWLLVLSCSHVGYPYSYQLSLCDISCITSVKWYLSFCFALSRLVCWAHFLIINLLFCKGYANQQPKKSEIMKRKKAM